MGCNAGESCRPVGTFGWDNNQGTLCVADADGGAGAPCTSVFQCGAGLGCNLNDAGVGMCLQYCVPGSVGPLSCDGVRRSLPDGGFGGPASCVDIFQARNGGAIYGASAINSIAAGYCD